MVIKRWTDCSIPFKIKDADLLTASGIKVTFKQNNKVLVIDGDELHVLDRTHIRVDLPPSQTAEFQMIPPYTTVDINFVKLNGRRCLATGKDGAIRIPIMDNNYDKEIT